MVGRLKFADESETESDVQGVVRDKVINLAQSQKGLYIVGLPLQLPEADKYLHPTYSKIEKIGGSRASTGLESVSHLLFRQLSGRESLARQVMAALNRTTDDNAGKYAFLYETPEFESDSGGKLTHPEVQFQRNMHLALEIAEHLKIKLNHKVGEIITNSDMDPREYGFRNYTGRVLARNFLYDVADDILHGRR
ncbi:MAG: hypothetical protein AABX54_01355 [Nanoarchaeota archaeon]